GFSLGPTLAYLHAAPPVQQILSDFPAVAIVLALVVPLLAYGLRGLRENRQAAAVLLPWLVGPPLLVFALALFTNVTYQVRYTLAALPAFAVLVALGVSTMDRPVPCGLLLGALLGCLCSALAN